MSEYVLTRQQREITRKFQDNLMTMHAVAEKLDLVIADDLKTAIDNPQASLTDRKTEISNSAWPLHCELDAHGTDKAAFARMLRSLAKAVGDDVDTPVTQGFEGKYVVFDGHYHGEIIISLDPAMTKAIENCNAMELDENAESFDEIRAGHMGDSP